MEGERDLDLSHVEALAVAFPEDAERAELTSEITRLSEAVSGLEALPLLLGVELSGRQAERVCAAALPLSFDWLTPEELIADDESGMPDEQKDAWVQFIGVVEGLHGGPTFE